MAKNCYGQLVKVRGMGNYLLWPDLHYLELAFDMPLLLVVVADAGRPSDRHQVDAK